VFAIVLARGGWMPERQAMSVSIVDAVRGEMSHSHRSHCERIIELENNAIERPPEHHAARASQLVSIAILMCLQTSFGLQLLHLRQAIGRSTTVTKR